MTGWSFALCAVLLAAPRPSAATLRVRGLLILRGRRRPRSASGMLPGSSNGRWVDAVIARVQATAGATAVAVCVVVMVLGMGAASAVAVGLLAAVGVTCAAQGIATRRRRRDDVALAQALTVLEAELVAGSREDLALRAAAAVGGTSAPVLREAAARVAFGDSAADVMAGSPALNSLSAAWRVRRACGAPLAQVIGHVARDLDLGLRRTDAVNAALAGPRSSGALMALLPVVGMGLGSAMGARPISFLFATPGGGVTLLVGVGLDVLGWFWTGVLVRRARS